MLETRSTRPSPQPIALRSWPPHANSGVPTELGDVAVGSYEAVVEDPRVEAVYLPLPNSLHREWAEKAASAGKHVLCEKPIATSVADAAAMFSAGTRAGVLVAEAYMTPFHPRIAAVRNAVTGGSIGELRAITSEFTFTFGPEARDNYRWRPEHGGGALWDLGIYTMTPIIDALPDADVVNVVSSYSDSGVDATTVADLSNSDVAALAICSYELPERQRLVFRGTEGTIEVDRAFTPGLSDDTFRIQRPTGSVDEVTTAATNPYRTMLEAFAEACRGGQSWPRGQDESLAMVGRLAEIEASGRQHHVSRTAAP